MRLIEPVTTHKISWIRKIYAHDHCADGTSAAAIVCMAMWLLGKRKGVDYEVELVQYKTKKLAELEPEPYCLFVDITPQHGSHLKWVRYDPIVLDHHATAEGIVRDLGGEFGGPTESGASMAFKHVLEPVFRQRMADDPDWSDTSGIENHLARWQVFAELCAVRDTWQEGHPSWDAAQSMARGIYFHAPSRIIDAAANGGSLGSDEDPWTHYELGAKILRKELRKAFVTAKTAYRFEVAGVRCAVINCTENIVSEACQFLLKDGVQVAISYFTKYEEEEFSMVVSLRTAHGAVEAKRIAEALGGGGHPRAAGFAVKNDLDVSVARLVDMVSTTILRIVSDDVLRS